MYFSLLVILRFSFLGIEVPVTVITNFVTDRFNWHFTDLPYFTSFICDLTIDSERRFFVWAEMQNTIAELRMLKVT
jgi:hypothetical protein